MIIGRREITFERFIVELFTIFISKEVKLLGEDLVNNHHTWTQRAHYITNMRKRIRTANFFLSIDFHPSIGAFNVFEKIYIKSCIKKSNILTALNKSGFRFKD